MSEEFDETTGQPRPTVQPDQSFIQDLVIADIEKKRRDFDISKYGTALQIGNGRDMATDVYEEILDLLIRYRGLIEECRKIIEILEHSRDDVPERFS